MLTRLKQSVMQMDDGADVMKFYLEYPKINNIMEIINAGFDIKERL